MKPEPEGTSPLVAHLLGVLAVLTLVAFGAAVRIELALSNEDFDTVDATGMLKSDPGLLYYLTGRVIEAGGASPEDFGADPRIEHPSTVDVPATFTVGQEYVIAWAHRLFGGDLPLHVLCVWVMGICASLVVVGVYGLAWELTRSVGWASVAGAFCAIVPASYRTIGFVLIREDLSLPIYALHLWALARAFRVGGVGTFVATGALAGLAAATWHAMGFVLAIEAGVALLWFLRSGENAFERRGTWAVVAAFAAVAVFVPVLRAKVAILSPPMQISLALLAAAAARRRPRIQRVGICLGALAALVAVSAFARTGADFRHVFEVLVAKVVHLGRLPEDPSSLSFDARLLWQGPFATLTGTDAYGWFRALSFVAGALVVLAALRWWKATGDRLELALLAFCALALVAAWMVSRLVVLPALLVPALLVRVAAGLPERWRGSAVGFVVGTLGVAQLAGFVTWARDHSLPWYPPLQRAEIQVLVRELPNHVPEGEAIAADFINSTAILAHTGRPIVLQPKWETAESRRRVREFWDAFYDGTPDELRELLVERYDCRYLLVDRFTLWILASSRYVAGFPMGPASPRPGTASELLSSQDAGVLGSIPGYELLWRSPENLLQSNGRPTDFFRLFRLAQ